jgi:hypothetical protein
MLLDEWVPVGKSEVDKKVYDSMNVIKKTETKNVETKKVEKKTSNKKHRKQKMSII